MSHDCGYPIAVKVTVENGRGALVKFREAEGNITIGPPRSDEEEGETAYYSGISCCENPYDDFNYTCDET